MGVCARGVLLRLTTLAKGAKLDHDMRKNESKLSRVILVLRLDWANSWTA